MNKLIKVNHLILENFDEIRNEAYLHAQRLCNYHAVIH